MLDGPFTGCDRTPVYRSMIYQQRLSKYYRSILVSIFFPDPTEDLSNSNTCRLVDKHQIHSKNKGTVVIIGPAGLNLLHIPNIPLQDEYNMQILHQHVKHVGSRSPRRVCERVPGLIDPKVYR
eukprot:TRINITY_DN81_c0_g1_i2.p1 TRINITY_DN81_c0_g1~~TRINITY_DN81_c0_g1_i2.p1  ORF type:complete len:123 (-),score=4.30 TRINITY_DN81_c0_g1_i2:1303-1671(-)